MKRPIYVLLTTLFAISSFAEDDLMSQIKSLVLPSNQAPGMVSKEKLYSVQNRYSDLSNRHEVFVGAGTQVLGEGHIDSRRVGIGYQYHFNNTWAVEVTGSKVFNEFNSSGEILLEKTNLVPDKDYLKYRFDAAAVFNTFYGKFRFGMERVFYFDQYISLGAGMMGLESGTTPAVVADIGLSFWLEKNYSVRFGFKNEFYNEQRLTGEELNHNLVTHLEVGYVFGDSK